jgi:hypothetical protein
MLKLFTRYLLAASALLLLAYATPSAFAANHSHSATFRASRHRGARHKKTTGKARHGNTTGKNRHGDITGKDRHGDTTGKARHGKAIGKARHASKSVRLVVLRDATTLATPLLGETALEYHSDYVNAGEAEAFRVQASASAFAGVAHVYIDARNGARTLFVGLYSSASGHPAALLSSGSISIQNGA